MSELLSTKEIEDILEQLGTYSEVSITDITPREISRLQNEEQKNQYESDFKKIVELYVKPLENTLNYLVNKKNKDNYVFSFEEYSIKERLKILQRSLHQFGLLPRQILDLVPQNQEEINIILNAIEKGYMTNKIVNNDYRVNEAKEYLETIDDNRKL